jgi:hypothetical protein
MDSGDDILTHGAPRPFPMSTQMLQSIQRTEKRLSGGVGENGTQGNKRTDDDNDDDMYVTFHGSRRALIARLKLYGTIKLRRYLAI